MATTHAEHHYNNV